MEEAGWQGIETAPDDGREIVVYRGDLSPDEPNIVAIVKADGAWWRRNRDLRSIPTHWQPLPSPPELQQRTDR
jgi:hypothetical protein